MSDQLIKVRKATKADLPSIFHLVKELAIYEKEPDAVKAELIDYENAFQKEQIFAVVAEHQNRVIGNVQQNQDPVDIQIRNPGQIVYRQIRADHL